MRKKKITNYSKAIKALDKKKKGLLYNKFTKYIVDYRIEDNNLRVYSNVGKSRLIKNTRSNQVKLNHLIIKNKIAIANKIDEYENTSKERAFVLIFNMICLCLSGMIIPLSFFMGNYVFFLASIGLFSFLILTTSIITVDYYVLVQEIRNLKSITGYKKEMEFELPQIKLNKIKTR